MSSENHTPFYRCLALAMILVCIFSISSVSAKAQLCWDAEFNRADKEKLTRWIEETHGALEALIGALPFDMQIYMHRRRSTEPVPWAHTERSGVQGVHFHVDPSFSLQEFLKDWTAPHEMSHLVLPYLGRADSWFAEGFATYMQYQVMRKMGVLSGAAMKKRYLRNFKRAEQRFTDASRPFAHAAPRLRSAGDYPTMYWGGAAYFLQVNDVLMTHHKTSIVSVMKDYVACCRRDRSGLDELVVELDSVTDADRFTTSLARFRAEPGFPEYLPMIPNAIR